MPSGSARQTTLPFNKEGLADASKNNREDDRIDDENENEDITASQKRTRTDFEINNDDDNGLPLDTDASTASMFSSNSRETIKNASHTGQEKRVPREYRPPIGTANIRHEDDSAERVKIVRLERLKDKEDRYSSHIQFLKDCKEAKTIPKGLRIELEPSIGNNDADFCEKWYNRLEEFSITLINDIIAYSEQIENDTAEKIRTQSEELKKVLEPDDLKEVTDTIDTLSIRR